MKSQCLILLNLFWSAFAFAAHPDSTREAHRLLNSQRELLLNDQKLSRAQKAGRMLALGLWLEAEKELNRSRKPTKEAQLVRARLRLLQHHYADADRIVTALLRKSPADRSARLLRARLQMQAWTLPKAAATCLRLLKTNPNDEAATLLLGRIRMLEQNYPEALRWAKEAETRNPQNAEAYLLESDVHFWNQQPEKAEEPLKRCLELDPFNADARFNYGYAIWRRVDATQLRAMADQWELALEVNPLHFVTHWHWGNGHTHLTYADYLNADDEEVRARLRPADQLISQNKISEAINLTREVEKQYPASVLPAMLRGSVYYMAFDMDRRLRQDSAQAIFSQILQRKKHYGPAHNGLAAVIKQRQIPYLWAYDSLTSRIEQTTITDSVNFARVFPDVNYYPGDRVQKMVWGQLYESIVYFPFLAKQNRQFVIPPLHTDLATAMKEPYFRQATTFDNRQWMDIRGVGSGAAAVEYVVRGAYLERNVVLHEYVHLFHSIVFTDAENRRVRQLYYQAMQQNRTLDYYSANNEHEYLAQTYPAYFERQKVHPSDHKSINTTSMLRTKDPAMYSFLDSLVRKQRAYLNGNRQAMADNWAEVYTRLSDQVRAKKMADQDFYVAAAYLDTALVWHGRYLPAYLSYVALKIRQQKLAEAGQWLEKAKKVDPSFAPIYTAEIDWVDALYKAGQLSLEMALQKQEKLYEKALSLENDYLLRAEMNHNARQLYARYARIPQAIQVAEEYVRTAPTVSTYLRDQRDEALAFAGYWRGITGAPAGSKPYSGSLKTLSNLVLRKPQNYLLRSQFAEVLMAQGMYPEAIQTLQEAQRILDAAGQPRTDFTIMLAECALAMGDTTAARQRLQVLMSQPLPATDPPLRLIRVLTGLGELSRAEEELKKMTAPRENWDYSDYQYTLGKVQQAKGNLTAAMQVWEVGLKGNPYHLPSRTALIEQLEKAGRTRDAQIWRDGFKQLY
jgi:tetratricopeptide (TPR) repeat protein